MGIRINGHKSVATNFLFRHSSLGTLSPTLLVAARAFTVAAWTIFFGFCQDRVWNRRAAE
jgi:hypothetical protein